MKYLVITNLLLFGLTFVTVTEVDCQNKPQTSSQQLSSKQSQDVDVFIVRLKKPEHINILQGAMWTVTHDYADFKHMQEVLKSFQTYFEAVAKYEKGDNSSLAQMGGIKSFKDKLSLWLSDDDQAIRAFAAVILGISGDKAYAPQVANLLKERKYKDDDLIFYDRGRAATALGLMGAKEFLPEIALLLQSKNEHDRSGAITALGYFDAKEYAKEVAGLLTNKEFQFADDSSPIYFLIETGAAKDYKKELVQVMLGEFRSETREAAMYALVHLDARENAQDIAKLFNDKFKKGDAAKALALLGAKEYSDEIALMLKDENSLVRIDAALALGILKAKKYSGEVAKLLKDKESFVENHAAVSLILMEATDYYKDVIPIVEKPFSRKAYLTDSAFHPLVLEKSNQVTDNLKKLFENAKAMTKAQKG